MPCSPGPGDPALTPEELSSLFNAGGQDDAPVAGDRVREAVASLRGYAYQAYVTALEWTDLLPDAELHLEVAEDFAVAARGALRAVQVKDQAGAITLASEVARSVLDAFVGLVAANPGRQVRMVLLTTASPTLERTRSHRPGGVAGLAAWSKVAGGMDPGAIAELRRVLLELDLNPATKDYIRSRDDDRLRRELVGRIEWRCGQAPLGDVAAQLGERVAALCQEEMGIPSKEGARLAPHLVIKVLETSSSPGHRVLRHSDLRGLIKAATDVLMPRGALQAILEVLAGNAVRGGGMRHVPADASEAEASVPMPGLFVPRPALTLLGVQALASSPVLVVHGSTGMGKTLLAREVARQSGGEWRVLDVRGLPAAEAGERLLAFARRPGARARGVIADDVADLDLVEGRSALARAARALADRGERLVVTTPRPPGRRARDILAVTDAAMLATPALTGQEIIDLVRAAGGSDAWATPLQIASRGGHPQLANALASGLRARGWPDAERDTLTLAQASEILEEMEATRRRLVAALPDEEARHFLHRLCMLADRFPRSVALAAAEVPPSPDLPGERFDALVGPWIDQVGADRFRVSPLLAGSGTAVLPLGERHQVHRAIARAIVGSGTIEVDQAANAFLHGLQGTASRELFGLAAAVVRSTPQEIRMLRPYLWPLVHVETGKPIFPGDTSTSLMLRLAQFELLAAGGASRHATSCARALTLEARSAEGRLELAAISKILVRRRLADILPEWPALVARFLLLLADAGPDVAAALAGAPGGVGPGQMLFGAALIDLTTVAALASAFECLGGVDPAARASMLAPMPGVSAPQHLVARAWLREREDEGFNPVEAAGIYGALAELARGWGDREWAVGFYVAQSAVLSEAAHDGGAALRALDGAVEAVGDAPRLRRARAKIARLARDDIRVVALVDTLADDFREETFERFHMLRDGAVSAGKVGEYAKSGVWFSEAARAAASERNPAIPATVVGLEADAAAAEWMSGQRRHALRRLKGVLAALADLDPASDKQAGYVHRAVRHALLWFTFQAGNADALVDGLPPALPPGTCSNPAPSPAVLDLPLMPLDLAWYTYALLAHQSEEPGLADDIGTRRRGPPILVMEVSLAKSRIDAAIRGCDADMFAAGLPPLVRAAALIPGLVRQAAHSIAEWGSGDLSSGGSGHDGPAAGIVRDAVLCFGIAALSTGREEAVDRLATLLWEHGFLEPANGSGMASIFDRGASGSIGKRGLGACVAAMAGPYEPNGLLEVCVRIALHLERTEFSKVAVPPFAAWTRRNWRHTAATQRFALRAPAITAPAILQAAEDGADTLRGVGALLLVAMEAVTLEVPDALRSRVRDLAAGER